MFKHSENLNEVGQGENLYSTAYFAFQENGEKYFFENTDYLENASISWLNEKKDFKYVLVFRSYSYSRIG